MSTDVELRLSADVDKATRDVGKFRKEYVDLVREVERPLRQVNAFRSLENDLEGTQRQMRQARDRVRELAQALASTANPTRAMQAEYREAVSELSKLERAEGLLTVQLGRRRSELQAAGIDTRNLANEQTRLATALTSAVQQGNADLANVNARKALGVGAIEDAQRSLVELRRQYQLVSRDGSLSATERAEAETNYRREVRETLQQLRTLRDATRSAALTAEQAAEALVLEQRQARAAYLQTAQAARQTAIEAARGDLGVVRYRALKAELRTTREQYELLRRSGMLTTNELAVAQRTMTQRVRETERALRGMHAEQARGRLASGGAGSTMGSLSLIGRASAAYGAFNTIRGIARISDEYANLDARLRLVTDSQEEFNKAQEELRRIADQNQAPFSSLVTLYARIAPALREAGRSQREILGVTEVVSATFRISGATAEEATNGVIQFAQALGAGALRGDEFNSVAEQAPRLMQALADGLGEPIGRLRDLAAEGELTASRVTEALLSQSEAIKAEAAQLPETVGGAMTRLSNAWNEAVSKADTTPLISSLDSLKERVGDPATAEGLARLSGAMVTLGGIATGALADFGDFGDLLGALPASLAGNLAELDRINNEIRAIEQSLDGSWSPGDILTDLFFSEEELRNKLQTLQAARAAALEEITGMNEEQAFLADVAAGARELANNRSAAAYRAYVDSIGQARDQEREKAKATLKSLVDEEKKANGELEKVRKARLDIEKSYSEALDKIGGSGAGEPSYGAAQQLKVNARQALQRGDFEEAQRQARAARDMLVELAEAGENTYGFEGFIKELQSLDLAANTKQEEAAAKELQRIQGEIEALKAQAEQLKDMDVSVKLDDASLAEARNQLAEFAKSVNGTELVIPVRTVYSDGSVDVTDLYNRFSAGENLGGFSGGGWTGPGSKYKVAGVVHADEYVQPKYRMREPGALAFMEAFRRHGMSILRNGYADGGLVSMPRTVPYIPPMPAVAGAGSMGTATLNLMLAGQQYTLQGDNGTIEALLKAGKRYGLKKG